MSGENSFRNIINLGNSIIGVSILAMPYCFQKCGIFLSFLLIIASGLLTKATCHLLLKSAIKERRRNFEFLAFHTFGTVGKFAVEFGIIGFLLGSCIAFFVVIGDLSPPLVSEFFSLENTPRLRFELLLILGFFIALPLGLLRKVESLTSFSTISVCFYVFLIFKIFAQALPNCSYEKLMYEMNWWQPAGLLSSLPIFAMALSCQTQLFEIFDTLNEPSLKRMDTVVSSAVNMCSSVYSLVGLFGYIAFYDGTISGNVLVGFPNTFLTKIVKMAFVLTVVVSFPLCLFPCRSSLHSLVFKAGVHEMPGNLIPDHRFRLLTFFLVAVTIGTAIMIPNIEFVLGILGSTIGTTICFILPALIFICNTTKDTNERIMAKVVLSVGIFILFACSYSTLHDSAKTIEPVIVVQSIATNQPQIIAKTIIEDVNKKAAINGVQISKESDKIFDKASLSNLTPKKDEEKTKLDEKLEILPKIENDQRQEPPIPQEPEERRAPEVQSAPDAEKSKQKPVDVEKKIIIESHKEDTLVSKASEKVTIKAILEEAKSNVVLQEESVLDPDAFKKEDKELNSQKKQVNSEKSKMKEDEMKKKEADSSKKQDELLRKIEQQQVEQKKLLDEQRQLLEELKEHKESHRIQEEAEKKKEEIVPEKSNVSKSVVNNSRNDINSKLPKFLQPPQIVENKENAAADDKKLLDKTKVEENNSISKKVEETSKVVVVPVEEINLTNERGKSIGSKNGYIRSAKMIDKDEKKIKQRSFETKPVQNDKEQLERMNRENALKISSVKSLNISETLVTSAKVLIDFKNEIRKLLQINNSTKNTPRNTTK